VAPVTGASSGTTAPAPVTAPTTGTLASTGPGRPVGVVAVIGGVLLILGMLLLLAMLNIPQRAFAGIFDRDGGRKVRPPVAPDRDGSRSLHVMKATSSWAGHLDDVGQRLGRGATAASGGARGLTSRVVSISARTAAWLLGR
jgi:hypothetical protein